MHSLRRSIIGLQQELSQSSCVCVNICKNHETCLACVNLCKNHEMWLACEPNLALERSDNVYSLFLIYLGYSIFFCCYLYNSLIFPLTMPLYSICMNIYNQPWFYIYVFSVCLTQLFGGRKRFKICLLVLVLFVFISPNVKSHFFLFL